MADQRVKEVAKILVDYSTKVKNGENVIITGSTEAAPLIKEIYKRVIQKGAYPTVKITLPGINYIYYKNASDTQLKRFPEHEFAELRKTDVHIGIISDTNTRELTNVYPKKIALRQKTIGKVSDYIANANEKIRRVTTLHPTISLAQDADMSLEEFENFVYRSMLQDWKNLAKGYNKIKNTLNKAKEIRLLSPDTDLRLKVYRKSFVADNGEQNFPGGEVFCAPETKSVEGHIRFTYPAIRNDIEVSDIYVEFKKGKCVVCKASKNEKFLKSMLNTDPGSKYLGEFGIGLNSKVTKFTKNPLFDEKIIGTIHLAFGMAYRICGQPNKSAIHWDMVKDMKKGKILADGKVIQKNGKWLI